ncbi:SDR family NAD(P)-dependent oxidoreductase [Paenibacillus donghaensis]|uniref:SDR family oxidoreductase n=1 Tax=Paenibacillus donghaensis TaxID=414771 RepID=A0A2Z2KJJ4_9BACL|nr:SDR family oxidoreductase [Paenibacillus donghaensis]ASA23443.1 SDR family oxidoreductase [Paenibacillus donghaensis]
MSSLLNQVALITGAGTGLGRATAIHLAAEGAEVVLVGRRRGKLEEVAQIIEQSNGRYVVIPTDVTNPEEVQRLREQVLTQLGRVDVLINNAGGTGTPTSIHDMTYTIWDSIIRLNLYSPFLVTNAILPVMREQHYGRIVSITSALSTFTYEGFGAYSAAKAGMDALMRMVALEEAKNGILVNMFDPGNLKSEQNPHGAEDPATVVDDIINLATLPINGPSGQILKAN